MRSANLVTLPTIITGLGKYLTRDGEIVEINFIGEPGKAYAAIGTYSTGEREDWDISGRVLPVSLSPNDIVSYLSE